jgi:hypothetical protein
MLTAQALLLAAVALAEAPAQQPAPRALATRERPDRTPTAWACTVDTLISGKDCLFEAGHEQVADAPAQREQNVKFARNLAKAACGKALKPEAGEASDATLLEVCERDFALAADSCGVDGRAVLVDGQGRFSPQALGCYRSLSDVLQRLSLMGSLASSCCRCMLRSGCKTTPAQCYRNVSRATPTPAENTCMSDACGFECSAAPERSRGAPVEAALPSGKTKRRLPANAL